MSVEILGEKQKIVLPELVRALSGTDFYLAGGTALALQMEHRPSVDFDWFSPTFSDHTDQEELFRRLASVRFDHTVLTRGAGTVYVEMETVQVSFIGYRYPLLDKVRKWGRYQVPVAGLDDIACMKLSAIANRGLRKDFYDLHHLVSTCGSLGHYLRLFQKKFKQQDVGYVIRSLVYFDEADQEPDIQIFTGITWEQVRQDIEKWVARLS